MTRGGINFIYTPLCVSIACEVMLSITYKVVLNITHGVTLSITCKPILSNSYKVEMLYIYIYIYRSITYEVILKFSYINIKPINYYTSLNILFIIYLLARFYSLVNC